MKPTSPISDDDRRRASALGDRHLGALFDCRINAGAFDLDSQLATGRYSPDIERLKGPLQALERREGLLIQEAFACALRALTAHDVATTDRVVITESDRKWVAGNRDRGVSDIGAPHAGDEVGRGEIDVWAHDAQARRMWVVDVKRAPRARDGDLRALKEAALALKRRHAREGRFYETVEIVVLRWFGEPTTIKGARYASSQSIDALFDVPISDFVSAALYRFREGLNHRLRTHVADTFGGDAARECETGRKPTLTLIESARLATATFLSGRRP